MPGLLADALVLVFTDRFSVRGWQESGQLERDWALGDATARHYRRLVLVTHGPGQDRQLAEGLIRGPLITGEVPPAIDVIANDQNLAPAAYARQVPVRLAALLAEARTAVVRTQHFAAGSLALSITARLRADGKKVGLIAGGAYLWSRFVAHEHGPGSPQAVHAAAAERDLCAAADAFIGTTGKMVDDLAWRHALDPAKGAIVPNYVLTDGPVPDVAERERGLLVYSGLLVKRKRVEILIQAVARLPDALRATVRFDVLGDGPMLGELTRLAKTLSAPVRFLPRQPHAALLAHLRKSQLFLHASELEGHPRAVIDAMATGTPVLVADTPGLGSVIQHGATGIRVPADPDAFATAIGELLADDDWREMLGTAASRVTRSAFGLDQVIPLELAAQRLALERGSAVPMPIAAHRDAAMPVRWDAAMLGLTPDAAAEAWLEALRLYAANLSPRAAFDLFTTVARRSAMPPRAHPEAA